MAITAYNYKNLIYTIKNIIYMYFISIFLAGSIYLINTSFFPHVSNQALSLIILVTLSPIISFIYIKNIKKIRVISSNYYKASIYLKDKPKIDLIMYLDTGNILFDPYNHKPIILVSKKIISKEPSKFILVPYNTIDSHNLLKCFSPNKFFIEGIGFIKDVLIGLIDDVKIDGADGILNVSILERMTIC